MSLIDALAIVTCVVACGVFLVVFMAAAVVAIFALTWAGGKWFFESDGRAAGMAVAWWVASLGALVLLIWVDGNLEPWWP